MDPQLKNVKDSVDQSESPAWQPEVLDGEHTASLQDSDFGGERQSFDLIMRDVDDGCVEPLVQELDLGTHLDTQLGVEI